LKAAAPLRQCAGSPNSRLAKPVLAINTATFWWALRRNGIADRIDGFGSLLSRL
jgi:maleate isomerase